MRLASMHKHRLRKSVLHYLLWFKKKTVPIVVVTLDTFEIYVIQTQHESLCQLVKWCYPKYYFAVRN